jgi:hypothetical protein
VHDALDPEMSILKQRIARRLRHEGHTDESVKGLDLGEQAAGCAACMPCSCVAQALHTFQASVECCPRLAVATQHLAANN